MSQENVEIVQRLWEAAKRRDSDAVLALYDPDVELDGTGFPLPAREGAIYRGHEGLKRLFGEWREIWQGADAQLQEIVDAGDRVVSIYTYRAQGRTSGTPIEEEFATVSTIESGKIDLQFKPVSVPHYLREVANYNRLLAERKKISLVAKVAESLPAIAFDQERIRQVLNNLLQNAVKFSYPGTVVTVELNRTDRDVVISINDQGQGIPAEEMDRLFKPFQKMSVRSTGGEPSTGLGLAIAKRIVAGHGGEIWAESKLGAGSTFYFRLPLRQ